MSDYASVVRAFGRGTAAGDAVFRCYARPTKASTVDPELLERARRHSRRAAAAPPPPLPVPKSQAMIQRPRVGCGRRPSQGEIARMRLDALPHKKSGRVIAQEMRARSPLRHPEFGRRLLNDNEKDRLGLIFQFGAVPPKPKEFTGANRIRYAALDKKYELNERLAGLQRQVENLRAELQQVKAPKLHALARQSDQEANEREVMKAAGMEIQLRFPRIAADKILERRAVEQRLTLELSELLSDIREVDEEIRKFNEEEEKRSIIKS